MTDEECLAVWHGMKDNGGTFGSNAMQRRLWGEKGKGGKNRERLNAFLRRAESFRQGNDADIFGQLSDILGDDDNV